MAAPTQSGQEMLIGFGDLVITGYFMESIDTEPTATVEEIMNDDDETGTIIVSNPGRQISGRMLVQAASGSPTDTELDTLAIGDTLTVDSIAYRVTSWKVSRSRKTAAVDFSAIKEDSMTYT